MPHIYAPTDAEAAYGLAWATCEDNFEAVLKNLTRGTGRGAEVTGKAGAMEDYFRKMVRAEAMADDAWGRSSADYRAVLEGYTAGVNAYAAAHKLPTRAHRRIFPVKPKDFMSAYVVLSAGMIYLSKYVKHYMGEHAEDKPGLGSNQFAFHKNRTAYDRTTLMITPHWFYDGPISFYEYSVHTDQGWDFFGACFPGLPAPALGTNRDCGWAVTYNRADFVDVFELKLNHEYPRWTHEWKVITHDAC